MEKNGIPLPNACYEFKKETQKEVVMSSFAAVKNRKKMALFCL